MKYYEVNFNIAPCSQDAQDILSALAGEAGFETFEETATGLKGYVQQVLFDENALKLALEGKVSPLRTLPSPTPSRRQKTRTGMSNGNKRALSR